MAIDDPILTQDADSFLGIDQKREDKKDPILNETLDQATTPEQEAPTPTPETPETEVKQELPTIDQPVETNQLAETAEAPKTPSEELTDTTPQNVEDSSQDLDFTEGEDTRPLLDFSKVAQAKAEPEADAFLKANEAEKDFFGVGLWNNITEVGTALLQGAGKTVVSTAEAAQWVGEQGYKLSGVAPILNYLAPEAGARMNEAFETNYEAFQSLQGTVESVLPTETGLGDTASVIAQFGTGLFGLGKLRSGVETITKLPTTLNNATKVSIASMLGFDQHTENLGNVLEKFPELKGAVTEYFGKRDDDGLLIGRVKNLVDVAVGGVIGKAAGAIAPKVAATISEGMTKGIETLKHMSPWGWTPEGLPKTYLNFADDISHILPKAEKTAFMKKMSSAGDIIKGSADMIVMQMQSFLTTASHTINILGNTAFLGLRVAERAVGRGLTIVDEAVGGHILGGKPGVAPGEVGAMIEGIMKASALSIKEAHNFIKSRGIAGTLKSIGDPMDPQTAGTKLDYPLGAGAHTLKVDPNSKLGKFADAWGNWVINPNFKALGNTDATFRRMNYFADYNSLVRRKAWNMGLRGEALEKKVAAFQKKPPKGIIAEAMQFAKRNTFQADPEKFGKAALAFRDSFGPLGKGTVPFFNTLNNISKEKFQRFPPTALFFREAWKDLGEGGVQRADRLAKINTGLMFLGVTKLLKDSGIMTSKVSDQDRPVAEAAGKSEYSIDIMGKNYPFKDLDVSGGLLRLSADFWDTAEAIFDLRDDGEDKDIQDVITGAALLLAEGLTDSTWGESLVETIAAATGSAENEQDVNQFQKFLSDKGSATLVPNIVRRAATSLDQYIREAHTFLDKLRTSVPGLSDELPIKYDVYGRERTPTRQGVSGFLSPVGSRIETDDKFDNFLMESGVRIAPPTYTQSFSFGPGETARLDLREYPRIFSEMNRLIGELPHPDYNNKTLSQYLEDLTTGESNKAKQFRDFSNGPKGEKENAIRAIISDYRKQAREHLLENDPELDTLIRNEIRLNEESALALERFKS